MKLTVDFFFKSEHNQKRTSEIRIDILITEKSRNCSMEKAFLTQQVITRLMFLKFWLNFNFDVISGCYLLFFAL